MHFLTYRNRLFLHASLPWGDALTLLVVLRGHLACAVAVLANLPLHIGHLDLGVLTATVGHV
ncbi:MAG: hypothetical protein RBR89_01105 [Candidatus Bipolaricaulis sp.]|nr:hypothetical protein [Candidatus Bipolaricaulis sp.]